MVCKKCGYQNHSDAVFCSGCGVKLADTEKMICKKCGTANELNAVFCDHCGTKLKENQRKIPTKVIVSAAIVALIVIVGTVVGVSKFGGEKTEGSTDAENGTYIVEHDRTNISDTKDDVKSSIKNYMKASGGVILVDDYGEAYCEDEFVFDTTIRRDQVKRIIFLNTLDAVPQTAYDISEDMDGSVMVWMGDGDYLYIAADGMIIAPEDCSGMFANYTALEEICFNNCFDTTNVKSMRGMFMGLKAAELDLSSFYTPHLTDMSWMFAHWCPDTEETSTGWEAPESVLNISNFDTSHVVNMQGTFSYSATLRELDLSHFDTSKVTDMSNMFSYCTSLQELDLTSFDTSNVADMRNMFIQNVELEKLDVSSFDTSSVKNMENMFYGCCKLEQLDVSGFNTRRVMDMSDMFYSCYSLDTLDVSGFETSEVKDMSGMFSTVNINYLDLRGFDFSNVEDASYMFFASEELWDVDINQINLPANANTEMMFEYCPAFQEIEDTEETEYAPSGSWSDVRASVGGTVSYPWIFDEPVKNCTGFTLHYQITDVEYGKINGTYVVYRKTLNNNWERVGKFEVTDQSQVIKTFEFDQPVSFRELAVAAPSGRQFSFSVKMWFDNWEFQD